MEIVDEVGDFVGVGDESTAEGMCSAEDDASAPADESFFSVGSLVEGGVLDGDGAQKRGECGDGDVDDVELGSGEESADVAQAHRFLAAAPAAFGFGDCAKTSRKSFSSRRASSLSAATARSSSPRFMRTR